MLPAFSGVIGQAEQIIGGNIVIPRQCDDVAARNLLNVLFVFADLLLRSVKQLGNFRLACLANSGLFQACANLHE